MQTFADFGVSESICSALADKGITEPFPIQALTLPVALRGNDIIGQAKTGTGKTLGFGIPMLENTIGVDEDGWEKIPSKQRGKPQGLVILPTRELAIQVATELRNAAARRSVRIVELYGGRAYEPQQKALRQGAEIIVGTPGRLIDLMRHKSLDLSHVRTVVLDEADEMLDLGFLEDVETLLSATAKRQHTMLFSATMPGPVITMARRYMNQPTHIRVQDPEDSSATVKEIRQFAYRTHSLNKIEIIARILQARERGLTIIFVPTKRTAARLNDDLSHRGFAVGTLHGNLGQGAREQALRAFRNEKIDVLVATDVAARGIDVDNVTHVINYQCPDDDKTYIHRIGRTGRAGNKGIAITFIDWEDVPRWLLINRQLELGLDDPAETYHTSEHLYTDLDIPNDVDGKLPRDKRTRAGLSAEHIEDVEGRGRNRSRSRSRSGRSSSSRSSRRRPPHNNKSKSQRSRTRKRKKIQGSGF